MHFIERLHIEMSGAGPAARIPLKFRGQMVGYRFFKYRGYCHTSKEKEKGCKSVPQR